MDKIKLYYSSKFLIKSMLKPHFKQIITSAKRISKKNKKPVILILIDMAWCRLMYLSDYWSYEYCEMYNINHTQRKTIFSELHRWVYAKKLNNPQYKSIFNNKIKFNAKYNKFLGRQCLEVKESSKKDLVEFIKNKEYIIGKNKFGGGGFQIHKINISNYKNVDDLLLYLREQKIDFVEDLIVQHDDINLLYSNAVNTIRVITVLVKKKPHIIGAYLRVGKDKHVDNISSGGMVAPVNIKTGEVEFPAADAFGNIYYKHPITNVTFAGFKIPKWDEVISFANELALQIPEVRYVGWDIAITNSGPVVIEGNYYQGREFFQHPVHTKDKIGIIPKLEQLINK